LARERTAARGEALIGRPRRRRGFLGVLLAVLACLAILLTTVWGSLALHFRAPESMRDPLAAAFGLLGVCAIGSLATRRAQRIWLGGFTAAFVALLVWWGTIEPRNDRDWQTDVAVLPWAEVDGDRVTMHDVRNFGYRSETDYTPHYETRTYDLSQLDSVDLVGSYWMGDAIAHMMLSFGFGGKDFLAISIETRKERSESYSTIAGFFREYELYYVVADERDLIGLRTNYRKDPPEDVYVFRTNAPPANARRLFMSYVDKINSLKEHPEFYNTLTTNCTTNIWMHTKVNQESVPFEWRILLSGYVPELVYDHGRLDTTLPFAELKKKSRVNDAAHAAGIAAPDFSQRIRAGVPKPAVEAE
jgi:uncharacterized protein DUF4105